MSALLSSGWVLLGDWGGLPPPVLASLVGRGMFWLMLAPLLQHMDGPGLWRVLVATGVPADWALPAMLGRAEEGSQVSLLPMVSWSPFPVGLCRLLARVLLPLPFSGSEVTFFLSSSGATLQGSGPCWSAPLGTESWGWGSGMTSCPLSVPGCSLIPPLRLTLGCLGVLPPGRKEQGGSTFGTCMETAAHGAGEPWGWLCQEAPSPSWQGPGRCQDHGFGSLCALEFRPL